MPDISCAHMVHYLRGRRLVVSALKWLQIAIAAAAVFFCFRARGRAGEWLTLLGLVTGLRLLGDGPYRTRVVTYLRACWERFGRYSAQQSTLPLAATFVAVVLPSGWLFLSNNRTLDSGDTWPVVPTACSLVREGNWELSEFIERAPAAYRTPWVGRPLYCTLQTKDGGIYSWYPTGMVQFAVPFVAVARLLGADLAHPTFHMRMEKWTAAWLAAVSIGLFFLVALSLGERTSAAIATLLFAAGSVMFSTVSQGLWQHDGVIFWSLVFLLVEVRPASRSSRLGPIIQGLACGMMLACRLTSALVIVPLGIWLLVRDWRRALAVAGFSALAFVPWAILYLSIYGNPLGPSVGLLSYDWSVNPEGIAGVLFSPARGLFIYQPWIVLVALWGVLAWRGSGLLENDKAPNGWPWVCAGIVTAQAAMVGSWPLWWGGNCWGSRLLAEVVPFCALLCIPPIRWLCSSTNGKVALATLAALSFVVHAAGVYRPPYWEYRADVWNHVERVWSWSYPPFLAAWKAPPWPAPENPQQDGPNTAANE